MSLWTSSARLPTAKNKRIRQIKMHSLTCNGVGEFYLVTMQTEPFGLVAVEFIADDGTA